ncbi:MAG TPA: nucleotide disphospho-sugar-binding domain-containing protein, partial [Candidatus Dormibacteraeota bacterium]
RDSSLPPTFSGLPAGQPETWEAFKLAYDESLAETHRDFNSFLTGTGCPTLPERDFMYESQYLNLYTYPDELDYPRQAPLGKNWVQLESCVRTTDPSFTLPSIAGDGPLLYLSLGSLGSADVYLMQRLIEILGKTAYRVIVSMGPQHQEIRLAKNMWGAEFLPQTSLLPLVDLVITHGGNNTVVESLYFGKPMVALPLFWDQPDNAERLAETGLGIRLDPYRCTESELLESIEVLLQDEHLHSRLRGISERLRARPGTRRAADLIHRLAESRLPVAAPS